MYNLSVKLWIKMLINEESHLSTFHTQTTCEVLQGIYTGIY